MANDGSRLCGKDTLTLHTTAAVRLTRTRDIRSEYHDRPGDKGHGSTRCSQAFSKGGRKVPDDSSRREGHDSVNGGS